MACDDDTPVFREQPKIPIDRHRIAFVHGGERFVGFHGVAQARLIALDRCVDEVALREKPRAPVIEAARVTMRDARDGGHEDRKREHRTAAE